MTPRSMSAPAIYKFRLYIAGDAVNSVQAVENLAVLCREHLPDRHQIEIVDVLREPQRAQADGVIMTPLLLKLAPRPLRRIFGTLGQKQPLLQALGLGAGLV
jgi:circadian clock protein KaiB